jgi:hypothetical protein
VVSAAFNLPSGPSIVATQLVIFLTAMETLSEIGARLKHWLRKRLHQFYNLWDALDAAFKALS